MIGDEILRLRDRTRSAARRVWAIAQLTRHAGQERIKARLRQGYRELMALTRAVVRQAEAVARRIFHWSSPCFDSDG